MCNAGMLRGEEVERRYMAYRDRAMEAVAGVVGVLSAGRQGGQAVCNTQWVKCTACVCVWFHLQT